MPPKFTASKFKNAHPTNAKKADIICDLPISNASFTNNGIDVSDEFIAFHMGSEGLLLFLF
jgi:hypothetical protein